MKKKFDNEFQEQMENQLIRFKEENQYLPSKSPKKACFYSELSDNLYPPVKHGFLQYILQYGMPLHDYVNHVRSSQAYCINILYPMVALYPDALLEVLSQKTGKHLSKILFYEFEYSPETNILGEWKSDDNRPEEYITAVDLRIDTMDSEGHTVIFLIEVKFTEADFTSCGGFNSTGNIDKTREVCEDSSKLLTDFHLCYLNGAKLKRTYFDSDFNPSMSFKNSVFQKQCPFANNHQCLRNHTLARKLSQTHPTYFVLLHHESNESIMQWWNKYKNILNDDKDLLELTGRELVQKSGNRLFEKYYNDRYTLKI
ncbi:MAG TPA: hypothetical protein P5228_08150 [Bacteroidales bacterium]|nr:hypothetical protein [Bacteroidales bacterium]HRZ49826.1 hypothetical protein [Bacteroidales bacterium]